MAEKRPQTETEAIAISSQRINGILGTLQPLSTAAIPNVIAVLALEARKSRNFKSDASGMHSHR